VALRCWILAVPFVFGCEAVASVDLHYTSTAGSPDAGHPSSDGASPDEDANAIGPGGTCGCDITSGEGCCLPKGGGAPFCTSDSYGCIGADGLFVGCQASSGDSACCWSSTNASGGGAQLAFSASCTTGPTACISTSDCSGTTCELSTCAGITVGACGVSPACP